jgi:hypothetical protein
MKRRFVLVAAVAAAAFVAPTSGGAVTAGKVSACTDSFSGGQGGCGFQYAGPRVLAWAVAPPGTASVVIQARMPLAGGAYALISECSVSSAYPVCLGEPIANPAHPDYQALDCFARGTGKAVFGCFSQSPILQTP